jgi:DNA-binding NtrC family response regulator
VHADEGHALGPDLLPPELRDLEAAPAPRQAEPAAASGPLPGTDRTLKSNVTELERQMISSALARHRGNKARVARELGVSYPTLLGRIRAYRLEEQPGATKE